MTSSKWITFLPGTALGNLLSPHSERLSVIVSLCRPWYHPVSEQTTQLKVDPDRIGLWLLAPIGRYTCGIMAHRCWNESYAAGELPWDTGEPEPLLVEFVNSGRVQPTRTLEI